MTGVSIIVLSISIFFAIFCWSLLGRSKELRQGRWLLWILIVVLVAVGLSQLSGLSRQNETRFERKPDIRSAVPTMFPTTSTRR